MSLIRVLATTAVTLSHTFIVNDADTDAAAAVTVAVNRLDGTPVTSGTATVGTVGDGVYTFLPPASPDLDIWTVDWTGTFGGVPVTVRDWVEIVGGFIFGIDEARSRPPALPVATFPTAALEHARIGVEEECELICRQAMVPRFERVQLRGLGYAMLAAPHTLLRTVRAVSVNGVAWSPDQVAAVGVSNSGTLTAPGGGVWPAGANIVFEYEHGRDYSPPTVTDAAILRLRSRITMFTDSIPYRATSFQAGNGGFYRIATPDRDRTGIPEVDAVYSRFPRPRRPGIA